MTRSASAGSQFSPVPIAQIGSYAIKTLLEPAARDALECGAGLRDDAGVGLAGFAFVERFTNRDDRRELLLERGAHF